MKYSQSSNAAKKPIYTDLDFQSFFSILPLYMYRQKLNLREMVHSVVTLDRDKS